MSRYINGIGIAVSEAVHVDLLCVVNNNTVDTVKITVTYETLKILHDSIGSAIEAISKRNTEIKNMN